MELTTKLESLAQQAREVEDNDTSTRLQSIGAAIAGPQRGELASVDIGTMLDLDRVEERASLYYQRHPPILRWLPWHPDVLAFLSFLEWIRNVLVLLPIALTWWGLWQATSHYQQAIEKDSDLNQVPFLLQWEQGFPVLGGTNGPTFSEIARWDFFILLALVVLSFVIHLWRDVIEEWATQKAAAFRGRLENVLWELSRFFSSELYHQEATQAVIKVGQLLGQFEVHAQELMNLMAAQSKRVAELEERQQAKLEQLTQFTQGASDLLRYGRDMRQIYQQLQRSLDSMAQGLDQVSQRQSTIAASLTSANGSATAVLTGVRDAMKNLEGATLTLQTTSLHNKSNSQEVITAAREIGQLAQTLTGGQYALREAIIEVRSTNQGLADNLDRVAQSVASVASATGQVATKLDGMSGQLASLGQSNDKLANSIDQVIDRFDRSSTVAQKSAAEMSSVGESLRQTVGVLAHEASRLSGTMSGFKESWTSVMADMKAEADRRMNSYGPDDAARPTADPVHASNRERLLWAGGGMLLSALLIIVGFLLALNTLGARVAPVVDPGATPTVVVSGNTLPTVPITETRNLTGTDSLTTFIPITDSLAITETGDITGTGVITGAEIVPGTNVITPAASLSPTLPITPTFTIAP